MEKVNLNETSVRDLANDLESLMITEVSDFMSPYRAASSSKDSHTGNREYDRFPPKLMLILRSLGGNKNCIDCGARKQLVWASVAFGTVMCEDCAFSHIATGLDEDCTSIRSLEKHKWGLSDTLALLEGGNDRFLHFIGSNDSKYNNKGASLSGTDLSKEQSSKYLGGECMVDLKFDVNGSSINTPSLKSQRCSFLNSFQLLPGVTQDHFYVKYKEKIAKAYEKLLKERVAEVAATHSKFL